jgi:hypothetical protein
VQAVKQALAASFGARQRGRAWQPSARTALADLVAQLVRAVPLATLQRVQATGNVDTGRRQATAAAWARAHGRSWTLALTSSAAAEVLGPTGCTVRVAADGATCESACADGPLALTQIVKTECAVGADGTARFNPTARETRWLGGVTVPSPARGRQPPVETAVRTSFQLGYYDDDWLVFVNPDGEYFVLMLLQQ